MCRQPTAKSTIPNLKSRKAVKRRLDLGKATGLTFLFKAKYPTANLNKGFYKELCKAIAYFYNYSVIIQNDQLQKAVPCVSLVETHVSNGNM